MNRRWQANGEWQEKVSFFNVAAWDQLAENVAASITKGSRVIVAGRLEQREYETAQKEKRTVIEIVADEIGASMRWATVVIERTERTGGSERQQQNRSGNPAPIYGDEEPF